MLNPWPDDYTDPPEQQEALEAFKTIASLGLDVTALRRARRVVGHYLHFLEDQLRVLQDLNDELTVEAREQWESEL